MSSRVLAVAAAAITAAAVAVPGLAQSSGGGQTITFHELNKGSRFGYVDNPPRNPKHRRPVFSIGDKIVFANPVADKSGKIGELRAACTITKKARASDAGFNSAGPLCTGSFVLKQGSLFLEATNSSAKRTTGAITGGTGAYAGARGTFTSTTTKSGNNDVVTLLP